MTIQPSCDSLLPVLLEADLAFTGVGDGEAESVNPGRGPVSTGVPVEVAVGCAVMDATGFGVLVRRAAVGDCVALGVGECVGLGVGEWVGVADGVGLTGGSEMIGVGVGVAEGSALAVPGTARKTATHATRRAAARRAGAIR
ncbi:MAG: hypothetical protein JWL79_2540 [Frankiales bacterium]|nr:hypothetical protein [Frankiales bacterium]